MSLLQGLQFYPGKTFIHRLDPRIKLLLSLLLLATTFMYTEVSVTTIIIGVEGGLAALAGAIRRWVKTVYGAAPLIIAVFLMNYLVYSLLPGRPLDPMGIYRSFAFAYRLIAFLASFSIFFLTTTPEELGMALTKFRVPYIYTFAFISAIRFTPVLAQELQSIMDAQRSRGLELEKGNPLTRVKRYIPILVPLLVNVLRRSYELAEAMEVKCFGAKKERTYLKELKMKRKDYAVAAASITLFALAVYFRFFQVIGLP